MNPFKTRPDDTLCYALAIVFGGLTGYVEIRSGELLLPVMLLLVFGGLLGLAQPRRAGECALVLGLCIPASHHQLRWFDSAFSPPAPARIRGVSIRLCRAGSDYRDDHRTPRHAPRYAPSRCSRSSWLKAPLATPERKSALRLGKSLLGVLLEIAH